MKCWRPGVVVLIAAATGCGPDSCDHLLSRISSPSGVYVAEVTEGDGCMPLNTFVRDVWLVDRSAWVRGRYVPFSIKGAKEIALTWLAPEHLEIAFSIPGEAPDRIYGQDQSWGKVKISYRMVKWGQPIKPGQITQR